MIVLIFFCTRKDEFDEPMDGLVYGASVSLGYATYESGSLQLIVSSIAAMVIFILIVNRFLWQPAYHLAQKRFAFNY